MTTLVIDVADLECVKASMKAAFRGEPQGCRYSFSSAERLLETINPNRWNILKALAGSSGPISVREVALCVGRDIEDVQNDAKLLIGCGLIDRTPDGKLLFPYEAVHLEMDLKAAA
jgi:predicted transcriptional regulator